jgi:hypothetical protein
MILFRLTILSLVVRLTAASLSAPCPTFSISTIGGIQGKAGYAGDGGAATSAKLDKPYGIWGDGVNSLYIADYNNRRVRLITLSTGIISTFAGYVSLSLCLRLSILIGLSFPLSLYLPLSLSVSVFAPLSLCISLTLTHPHLSLSISTGDAYYYGDGGLAVNAALRKPTHAMGGSDGKIYISEKVRERSIERDDISYINERDHISFIFSHTSHTSLTFSSYRTMILFVW